MTDLGDFATADATGELTIKHGRTGEPTDIVFTLYSLDNPQVDQRRRQIQKSMFRAEKTGRGEDVIDEIPERTIDTLVAATVAWRDDANDGHITFGGKRVPCTAEHVRAVYTKVADVRDQADAFMRERKNFMKG